MKLKLMCVKYRVSNAKLAEILGVSRQTVSQRLNSVKGRYWNEPQMKKILEYFKTLDNSIKIEDLFF